MAGSVIVDAGFLIALLSRRDTHHAWAVAESPNCPLPWLTCDAVLSETFHLLGARGWSSLAALLRRRAGAPARCAMQNALLMLTQDGSVSEYGEAGHG